MAQVVRSMLVDRWTYLRTLYILLAFPLGATYFLLITTGLSLGISTAVIGVGLAVLVLTLIGWLFAGRFERELAIHLLGAHVRPFFFPASEQLGPWPRLLKTLGEPTTWKSLVYLLLEFPFGVIGFVLATVFLSVSLGLALMPVAYIVALAIPSVRPHILPDITPGLLSDGQPFGVVFFLALLAGAIGLALGVVTLALLNGIGWVWGRFAEQMLGVDQSRLQLAAAQAEAASQRHRAERSDQSRRELIVNASHELRTPIASINAHVESLMKPGGLVSSQAHQYLEVIESEAGRLRSLVDDLLLLARADADELRVTTRAVSVNDTVHRVCNAMAPLARQERNISLHHASERNPATAMADPDRLEQVLGNLIRNAVNHTSDGGIITVGVSTDPGGVTISVQDTGIGIEPADLPRIFDRFYRTDQSRSRDSGGSGLGLAIVRELVSAMGGSITVDSVPGQGSTFRLWLPAPS